MNEHSLLSSKVIQFLSKRVPEIIWESIPNKRVLYNNITLLIIKQKIKIIENEYSTLIYRIS